MTQFVIAFTYAEPVLLYNLYAASSYDDQLFETLSAISSSIRLLLIPQLLLIATVLDGAEFNAVVVFTIL